MSHSKPAAGISGADLTRLVYELLDAHDDTAQLAADLTSDPRWQIHLNYLRGLQRHGRESLARATAGPQPDEAQASRATTGFLHFLERVAKPRHHTSTAGRRHA